MSEKPKRLNLDILYPDQREALEKELEGATVVVTEGMVKAYRDGKEIDAHLDMIAGVIRVENGEGIYRVTAEPDESDQSKTEPGMSNLVSEVWANRKPRMTDAQAVATLKNGAADIYAARRAQSA